MILEKKHPLLNGHTRYEKQGYGCFAPTEQTFDTGSCQFRFIAEPTPEDIEIILDLDSYPPKTNMKPGDLVTLKRTRDNILRYSMSGDPQAWQIRFVVSAYQFEMHNIVQRFPDINVDQATCIMEERSRVLQSHYRAPVVYVHGFPHGLWPDSARWFPGHVLKKLVLRAPNQHWPVILDEFKAPLYGYDTDLIRSRFVLDLAPDLYSRGQGGRPLSHEEETFHSACLMGLEHNLVQPRSISAKTPGIEVWDGSLSDDQDPLK